MSGLKGRVGAVAASVAVASAAVIGLSGTASASYVYPCGFSVDGSQGVWNNCTGPGWDYITVDVVWSPDFERCVKPGVTNLGAAGHTPFDIRGASFLHKC